MTDPVPVIRLKKNEERRLKAGHLWVYSNEVDTGLTPLKELPVGDEAVVEDSHGKPLGRAMVNPHSLICARLFSRSPKQTLSKSFLKKRIEQAVTLRERLFPANCYRAVFGEADGLPGLVVDRYGDVFVLQTGTAGMEAVQAQVAEVLDALYSPAAIVAANQAGVRELEGLECYTRALKGELPETVSLEENGVSFRAPLAEGQKTGWFYDHRGARRRLEPLVAGARVLDVFSYCGGWGIQAACAGAESVTCVDSSTTALAYANDNAGLNEVAGKVRTLEGNAFDVLKAQAEAGEKYDVVILDPPAFIKRKKDYKNGLAGYRTINELALRLINPGGFLISASCSMHLPEDKLLDVIRGGARHVDRYAQVFAREGQAEDHPMHPAIPETRYLKSWFVRVLKNV